MFALSLVLGAIGAFVSTRLAGGWATVAIPVLVLIGYSALGMATRQHLHRPVAFADSVYYLGFLFTLLALFAALIDFVAENPDRIGAILARFGLALLTTIFGLSIRLYLIYQYGPDRRSLEDAERALARATDRYRQAVDLLATDTVGQVKSLHRAFTEAVEEFPPAFREATTRTAADIADGIRELTVQLANLAPPIRQVVSDAVVNGLAPIEHDLTPAVARAAERIGEGVRAVDRLVSSLSSLGDRVGAAGGAAESGVRRLQETVTTLGTTTAQLAEHTATARQTVEALAPALHQLHDSVRILSQQVRDETGEIPRALRSFGDTISAIAAHLKKLAPYVERITDHVDRLIERVQEEEEAAQARARMIRAHLNEGDEALARVQQQLLDSLRWLAKALREGGDSENARRGGDGA